jgi:hypothetical protein
MRRTTLVFLVFSLIFASFVFHSLIHVEPLQVTGEHIEHVGNKLFVRGTVTNTGSAVQSAALQVRLFDSAGRRMGTETLALGELKPGKSIPFSSSPIDGLAQKFTIQIDHGANMYGN